MQLLKLNALLPAAVAVCALLLGTLPVLGQTTGDPRVREAQTLLAEQNYRPGPVDGLLGPRTLSAILRFQIDRGLPPTRELDEVTLETLRGAQAPAQDPSTGSETGPRQLGSTAPEISAEPQDAPSDLATEADEAGAGPGERRAAEARVGEPAKEISEDDSRTTTEPPPKGPSVAAEQRLAQSDAPSNRGESGQAKESPAEGTAPGVQSQSKPILAFLPGEFGIEDALFIGLLVFAAVAVIAAIYTSIRGREGKEAAPLSEAADDTVVTRRADQDDEATVIAALEPTVTTPPVTAGPLPSAEPPAEAVTEFATAYTGVDSKAKATEPPPPEVWLESKEESYEGHPVEAEPEEQAREDPLADLNVHLAFERFDQAEALVKDAIERYPQRHEYLLRLLEVYVAARNPLAFEFHARALRDAVGEKSPLMAAALRWWDTISPDRQLFEEPLEEETRRV